MLTLLLASIPIALAALLAAGLLFQKHGLRQDARRFQPPGRLVQTPAGRFHVNASAGPGSVSIILESGLAGSSLSWTLVQSGLAQCAPVCSYDRTGFGWSSPIRSPRTLEIVVEELRELLEQTGTPQPYVLVGHSLGGLIVRAFAHAHPHLTAGLILVDPVSTEYWAGCGVQERARLQRGIDLAGRGAVLARLGLVRLALHLLLLGRRFLPEAIARMSAPGAASFLQRLTGEVRNLPPALWPIVRAQWSRPMGLRTISAYLASLEENCSLAESKQLTTAVPTTIISASTATAAELLERERWLRHSRVGRHVRLANCGHWIPIQQPDAVIDAVRAMLRTVAADQSRKNQTSSLPQQISG